MGRIKRKLTRDGNATKESAIAERFTAPGLKEQGAGYSRSLERPVAKEQDGSAGRTI